MNTVQGTVKKSTSQSFIQELNIFSKMPLTERQIIQRVKKGENLRLIDLNIVRKNYKELQQAFPRMTCFLTLKELITKEMLEIVKDREKTRFKISTIEEMKILLRKGIPEKHILFGHPAKSALEIKHAFRAGVREFVSDSQEDLKLLKHYAPKSYVWIHVLYHFLPSDKKSKYFDERFRAPFLQAKKLIYLAKQFHLKVKGISFDCGAQNRAPASWEYSIKAASQIFKSLNKEGMTLGSLNIGGLPFKVYKNITSLNAFSRCINSYLKKYFQNIKLEEIIIEPGCSLSEMAGVTIGQVINVKPSAVHPQKYIVTLSTGRFSAGLLDLDVGVNFYFEGKNRHPLPYPKMVPTRPALLFEKNLTDSDQIFEKEINVPADLQSGHFVVFKGTGAYVERAMSDWCFKSNPTDIIFDSNKSTE